MKIGMNQNGLNKFYGDYESYITPEESVEMVADAGYEAVDVCTYRLVEHLIDCTLEERCAKIKKICEDRGLEISQTHAHRGEYEVAITEEFFNKLIKDVEITAMLGCKYLVVHPVKPPQCNGDKDYEFRRKINVERFRRLRPYLEKYDVICCIENLFSRDENRKFCLNASCTTNELIDWVEELGEDRYAVCLDTGHLMLNTHLSGETVPSAIRNLGKYLKVLHVHDNNFNSDSHLIPYWGKNDWAETIKALKEINYKGVFSLELTLFGKMRFEKRLLLKTAKYARQICNLEEMERLV